jgi:hypothetical protein
MNEIEIFRPIFIPDSKLPLRFLFCLWTTGIIWKYKQNMTDIISGCREQTNCFIIRLHSCTTTLSQYNVRLLNTNRYQLVFDHASGLVFLVMAYKHPPVFLSIVEISKNFPRWKYQHVILSLSSCLLYDQQFITA